VKDAQDYTVTIGNFTSIKRSLDPDYGYIIFEKKRERRTLLFFLEDSSLFEFLERSGFLWQFYFDDCMGQDYLVMQCNAGKEEEVMASILAQGLPDDINYYLFKAKERAK